MRSLQYAHLVLPRSWTAEHIDYLRPAIAGGVASFSAQLVVVPVDVVSQHLMVGSSLADGDRTRGVSNGLRVARRLVARDGPLGLYRGFFLSLATYGPSSAVWWGVYEAVKHQLRTRVPSYAKASAASDDDYRASHAVAWTVATHAISGLCAAITSSFSTHPMDVVKTRYQVGGRGAARLLGARRAD